jgi:hypothetical protein
VNFPPPEILPNICQLPASENVAPPYKFPHRVEEMRIQTVIRKNERERERKKMSKNKNKKKRRQETERDSNRNVWKRVYPERH